MNNRSLSLPLFIAWLVCCTLIPTQVVRSRSSRPDLSARIKVAEDQVTKKLYTRVRNQMSKDEKLYKEQLEVLEGQQRKLDLQIKAEQLKIFEWRNQIAIAAKKNDEIKMKEDSLVREAEGNSARRIEIIQQIRVLRAQRNSNEKQIQQYAESIKQSYRNIGLLSTYPVEADVWAGWGNFGGRRFETIPEAKQHFSLALSRVQAERTLTERQYNEWDSSKTPESFTALSGSFTAYMTYEGASCSVDITSKKDATETTDATVKYQTPEQRQYLSRPKTAKSKTKCLDEKMKPDRYFMWTERLGIETSSRDELFPIANEKEVVTIIEKL